MAIEYKIRIEKVEPYENRIRKNALFNFVWVLVITAILSLTIGWKYGILIGLGYWIIQTIKSYSGDKYFIKEINSNEKLEIIYFENNTIKNIIGNKSDFRFVLKTTWNTQFTIYYLAVFFKNVLIIKQFETEEWNIKLFNEVVKNINNDEG